MKKGLHKTIQASFLVAGICFTTIGGNSFNILADDAVIIKDNSGLYYAKAGSSQGNRLSALIFKWQSKSYMCLIPITILYWHH